MCTCTALQSRIRAKAGEIRQKIEALHTLQSELLTMLNRWEDCGGGRGGGSAPSPFPQQISRRSASCTASRPANAVIKLDLQRSQGTIALHQRIATHRRIER